MMREIMDKILIIEIGTNSIKSLRAEFINGAWQFISEAVCPARLGENLAATGMLNAMAIQRNIEFIEAEISDCKTEYSISIIATESLRMARNANDFLTTIYERFGIHLEILTGDEEAELAYRAVAHRNNAKDGYIGVIDIGGGSTELTIGRGDQIISTQSLPIGAVKLTEFCFLNNPVTPEELNLASNLINSFVSKIQLSKTIKKLFGVGGTVTALAALDIDKNDNLYQQIEGKMLSLDRIKSQITILSTKTMAEKQTMVNMPEGRADIILAGAMILEQVIRKVDLVDINVSTKGVRHGYLFTRI